MSMPRNERSAATTTETRLAPDGCASWNDYWTSQGMAWRTEPDPDQDRQRFLATRRATTPSPEKGVYPFKDVKLVRSDVEWLLATHESEGVIGPVDWNDLSQRSRLGLDLRGADLSYADLSGLPLARLRGGLTLEERTPSVPNRVRLSAAVSLRSCELFRAHLEGASLARVHLEEADLEGAYMQIADLGGAHIEGAHLYGAHLAGAYLRRLYLDASTNVGRIELTDHSVGPAIVADAHWNGADLSLTEWRKVHRLGDEVVARQRRQGQEVKSRSQRLTEFERALRANRQLAAVLRSQGINEAADRFAYRARVVQRIVLIRQRHYMSAIGSWLLDGIAGYGYKPARAFLAYALVILAFAGLYLLNAQFAAPHLTWDEALVLSISSFHGRGFFSSDIHLGDNLARLAAGEAIIGLLIEITFIATFTQRFFAR